MINTVKKILLNIKPISPILLLLFIVAIGSFLRIYRLPDLMIFRADQAIDALEVVKMTEGHFTLLGPKASVGPFYNGPIVYYLMLPFFYILGPHPLSGTVFQVFLSITTIFIIFFLGKRISDTTTGYIASFLTAISPLFIDYSRAIFNSYPAVFFSSCIFGFYILISEKPQRWKYLLLGILLGCTVQMHYLMIVLVITLIIHPIIFVRKLYRFDYYIVVFIGFIIGLSPYLAFEFRHDFINIKNIIYFIINGSSDAPRSFLFFIEVWPRLLSMSFLGNYFYLGIMVCLALIFFMWQSRQLTKNTTYSLFFLTLFTTFCITIIYGKTLTTHYLIPAIRPIC
ncbi:MAG: glycosyltransferase family 39 protein [Candidatus Roizmanbacteria bacterium]